MTEDTRHTRILLNRFGIDKPVYSCHKFNEAAKADDIVRRIKDGAAFALVTDSGMPGISDPGSRMVTACRKAGVPVTSIPGPSAVTTAVALSGFVSNGFVFAGFAPRKRGAMSRLLGEVRNVPLPVALFESPYRLVKLLDVIEDVLEDRTLFVGRELTKKFEETIWGTAAEIRRKFEGRTVKGEIVVVIAPHIDS